MSIEQILKNTNYHLDLFSDSEIAALESCITTKQSNGQAISTDDLLKIPIALPSEEIAEEIVRKIQSSRIARRESRRLLDLAKRAVEIAIEQNESAALTWIEQ